MRLDKMHISWIALLTITIVPLVSACGDQTIANDDPQNMESGLDRNLLLSELDDDQRLKMCQWEESVLSSGSCPDSTAAEGKKREPNPASDCVAQEWNFPACSLGSREDCIAAISTNLCTIETPPECNSLVDCRNQLIPPPNCHPWEQGCFP